MVTSFIWMPQPKTGLCLSYRIVYLQTVSLEHTTANFTHVRASQHWRIVDSVIGICLFMGSASAPLIFVSIYSTKRGWTVFFTLPRLTATVCTNYQVSAQKLVGGISLFCPHNMEQFSKYLKIKGTGFSRPI